MSMEEVMEERFRWVVAAAVEVWEWMERRRVVQRTVEMGARVFLVNAIVAEGGNREIKLTTYIALFFPSQLIGSRLLCLSRS